MVTIVTHLKTMTSCPTTKFELTDKRYPSGRLTPVFPSLLQGSKREEEYIERMIARDREIENRRDF